jgi:predicted GNAT superfamily acetyltransferase
MIEIRPLTSHLEFAEALQLQREIWAFADAELLPLRFFVVASHVGGQVFAAFDGPKMAGFCIAIPGIAPNGARFLHSHMMGVLPEYHNRGIGRMLKLWQRDEALARSIRLVEWTFDPLEIKNAYFNLERLGAIVTGYAVNRYGITASALHGGLPTDRGIAEWRLDSGRVVALLSGKPEPQPVIEARIAVPVEIEALRHKAPEEARAIQKSVGEQFTECFACGLAAVGFERSEKFGTYLLGRENHS